MLPGDADQYQPAGWEPVTLNPPIAARLLNSTFSSAFVGTRQSLWPCASSLAAYSWASLSFIVREASAGVAYIGLLVSGEMPAKTVPSGILSPILGAAGSFAGAGFLFDREGTRLD